ncbi:MAG: hypothetical protein AAFP77_25485 [Bacteroidota bacterium]
MKTYLLLAALLATAFLPAQEVLLFDDVQEKTLVYRYHHLNGPSASALQQIIRCLGPNQLHEPAFDLTYNYQLQILEKTDGLKVCINWQSVSVDRELRPLGFPFADLLQPAGATFNLELLADGEVAVSKCVQQQFGNTQPSYTFDFSDIEGGVYYTLRVNDLHFNYGSREVSNVRNRKQAIDQYLIAKDELLTLHEQLDRFRQVDVRPQDINTYQQQLRGYQQTYEGIEQGAFWSLLELNATNAHDPERVVEHLATCEADLLAMQQWLDQLQAQLHVLYFDQGVTFFNQGQKRAAREAFRNSLATNECYAPSHYFIAVLDFEVGKIEPAGRRIQKVLNQYNPDPQTKTDARSLASGIVRYYLDAGQNAAVLRQYPQAVALYEEALAFSKSIQQFDFGQAEAISRIQEAYFLDYHEQIDQVLYTQQTGRYALALQQLEQARAFQQQFQVQSTVDTRRIAAQLVDAIYQENLDQIRQLRRDQQYDQALAAVAETEELLQHYPGMVRQPLALDSEKKQVLTAKFQTMLAQADQLIKERRLDQALAQAQQTQSFARSYELEASMQRESERQITRVQQLRYERFIRGGQRAKQTGDYAKALEQFEAAQRLAQQTPALREDTSLGPQIQATALAAAQQLFDATLANSRENNDQIRANRGRIYSLASRYNLLDQPEIQQHFTQLDDQLCRNANSILLPSLEQQLNQQQQARDYIAAEATVHSIQTLLSEYQSCGLSSAPLLMSQKVVEACANYQKVLQAAERAEQQRQYGQAIVHYVAAAEAYQAPSVQARLAGHPAFRLAQYVQEYPDYHMQLAGAHYFLDQRQHDTALNLLGLVLQRGTHPKATEGLQQRLGSALAVRHYVGSANWKQTFYGFVDKEDRKTYKTMYRSFRKQWKRMA